MASLATPARRCAMRAVRRGRLSPVGLAALALLCGEGALAQAAAVSTASLPNAYRIERDQRLSDWLLGQPLPPQADLLALSWRSAADVPEQAQQRARLQQHLKGRFSALAGVVGDLPATGRVRLPKADARWLQANAAADPWLRAGDLIHVAPRAAEVTVLRATGHMCQVPHQLGADIATYLRACEAVAPDRAWLVQPDGAILSLGVAHWNQQAQVAAAPGAWIWAPEATERVEPALSEALAQFLATQGPAPVAPTWSYRRQPVQVSAAAKARDLPAIGNDWGVVGLLQTPTARMGKAGTLALNFSRQQPYSTLNLRLQPVDWLEVAFGYMSISDRPYGPYELSGDQSWKDKSAHLKLRLWQESAWLPEVALGWRDFLGTGAFSGEYVVASKRFGRLDVSAGLGFGYVGGRGDVGNPLGALSDRFDTRPGRDAFARTGGDLNGKSYFRGPAAFFGGVQYHLPWEKWVIKAEFDGNDYEREPSGKPLRQRSPVNVGLVYRHAPWLDVTLGVERGNQAILAISAHAQLDELTMPKFLDARPVPVSPVRPAAAAPIETTVRDLQAQTGLTVSAIERRDRTWSVMVADPQMGYERPVVDKVAAVVHRDAPADIDRIELRWDQHGTRVAQAVVDRDAWVRQKTELVPESARREAITAEAVPPAAQPGGAVTLHQAEPERLSYGVGLSYRQSLGGPDAFLLYQLSADVSATLRLRDDTWIDGRLRLALLDNYDRFQYTAPSDLPRVRTYIREYLTTRNATIPSLQLSHMGQFGQDTGGDHLYLAYGGLLESMFAGVGAEYLYRPVGSRWSAGADVNRVRQRDFEQDFGLRDYEVITGHLTAYWDTGWHDVVAKLSVGQYLAGDRGATLDVSRVFGNGVAMGAYATRTDVSAERFGEGSFDKGVYVTIPFDAMLPKSGPSSASIVYAPLLRDGGARLNRRFTLFDLTSTRDPRALTVGTGASVRP
ncbi:MAG: YjbH domain-containing protein [Rubrivivax sp.]|nr:MAG: YjbH domain-containing protein [Rubrivivax sp.]